MSAADMWQVRRVRLRPICGSGTLRAFASAQVGPVSISSIELHEAGNGALVVRLPERRGGDGRPWPIVELEGDLRADVEAAVLAAWWNGPGGLS